jgi:hypothetical protein
MECGLSPVASAMRSSIPDQITHVALNDPPLAQTQAISSSNVSRSSSAVTSPVASAITTSPSSIDGVPIITQAVWEERGACGELNRVIKLSNAATVATDIADHENLDQRQVEQRETEAREEDLSDDMGECEENPLDDEEEERGLKILQWIENTSRRA